MGWRRAVRIIITCGNRRAVLREERALEIPMLEHGCEDHSNVSASDQEMDEDQELSAEDLSTAAGGAWSGLASVSPTRGNRTVNPFV